MIDNEWIDPISIEWTNPIEIILFCEAKEHFFSSQRINNQVYKTSHVIHNNSNIPWRLNALSFWFINSMINWWFTHIHFMLKKETLSKQFTLIYLCALDHTFWLYQHMCSRWFDIKCDIYQNFFQRFMTYHHHIIY